MITHYFHKKLEQEKIVEENYKLKQQLSVLQKKVNLYENNNSNAMEIDDSLLVLDRNDRQSSMDLSTNDKKAVYTLKFKLEVACFYDEVRDNSQVKKKYG